MKRDTLISALKQARGPILARLGSDSTASLTVQVNKADLIRQFYGRIFNHETGFTLRLHTSIKTGDVYFLEEQAPGRDSEGFYT